MTLLHGLKVCNPNFQVRQTCHYRPSKCLMGGKFNSRALSPILKSFCWWVT